MVFPHMCPVSQVVVNYSSSAGPAEEVAHIIEESGGEAITIGADISKPAEVDRSAKHWLSGLATVVFKLCLTAVSSFSLGWLTTNRIIYDMKQASSIWSTHLDIHIM